MFNFTYKQNHPRQLLSLTLTVALLTGIFAVTTYSQTLPQFSRSANRNRATSPVIQARRTSLRQSGSGSELRSFPSSQISPLSLNRWSSNGPEGEFVLPGISALAIDRSNPVTVYAGTDSGMYKSVDGGGTWSASNTGLPNSGVTSLAIDPNHPNVIYAGTSGDGGFKSTDGGATWNAINNGLKDQNGNVSIATLVIDPANPNVIYAATGATWESGRDGVFKSIDGGGTWSQTRIWFSITFATIDTLVVDPVNPNTIYAGGSVGGGGGIVFKSTDNGATWSPSFAGLSIHGAVAQLAIDPTNPSIIYARSPSDVFKSTNGSQNWSAFNDGLTNLNINALTIDPGNPTSTFVGTSGGVLKSSNGGSWTPASSDLTNLDVLALVIDPISTATIYAGTIGGGIFKSTSGGASWSASNNGLLGHRLSIEVGPLAVDPGNANTIYAGSFGSGMYQSTNNGGSWSRINNGLPDQSSSALAIDPSNPATIYVGNDSSVYKTTNGGASWSLSSTGLGSQYVYTLAIDPRNSNVIYAVTDGGVFKSTNGGGSWSAIGDLFYPVSLVIDPRNSQTLYAVSVYDYCGGDYCFTVFKSTDGGFGWNRSDTGTNFSYVAALAIDPINTTTIYVSAYQNSGSGIFKSTDGGGSWSAASTGLPDSVVSSLVIDPVHPNVIYAGTYDSGVFKSADGGASWNPLNDGLTNRYINTLAIDASGNFLHAGTPAGVFDYQFNVVCAYSTSAASQTFPSGGGIGTVNVTTTNGCNWQTTNAVDWITINSGATGTGDGTINFLVGANPGPFPRTATITIAGHPFTVNQFGAPPTNSSDDTEFFVRQHYLDFLNRQADANGLDFWEKNITSCGFDSHCFEVKRIDTSAAFFLSIEFQQTGYLVYKIYKAAYGNLPGMPVPIRLNEFLPDTQEIGQGVIVNQPGWEQILENNKQVFVSEFVQRSRFTSAFPTSMTPAEFVDTLFAHAGVTPSAIDRAAAINEFGSASSTSDTQARARALRRVGENAKLAQQEFNRAFVLMQYFGYLRRNPNDPPEATLDFQGYNFWLNKLNSFNGNFQNAEMVKAFISSGEYRSRFGAP